MILRMASAVFLLLFMSGLHGVASQTESPSPEAKSVFELAKETTIEKHTGLNVTNGEDLVPRATNATDELVPALAPSEAPFAGPVAAEPSSRESSGPAEAPAMVPALAPATQSNASHEETSTDSVPSATPAVTPSATNTSLDMAADYVGSAVDKSNDVIAQGASVASSSRYGSVIAGTLVAAVVVVGIAGTVLVWRHRSSGAYQGLHDTEMAMIRREH